MYLDKKEPHYELSRSIKAETFGGVSTTPLGAVDFTSLICMGAKNAARRGLHLRAAFMVLTVQRYGDFSERANFLERNSKKDVEEHLLMGDSVFSLFFTALDLLRFNNYLAENLKRNYYGRRISNYFSEIDDGGAASL